MIGWDDACYRRGLGHGLVVGLVAGLLLGSCSRPAKAAEPPGTILALAEATDGALVLLYTHRGPCVGRAHFAEHVAPSGERTPGCWILVRQDGVETVLLSFLDGERGDVAAERLKKPKGS